MSPARPSASAGVDPRWRSVRRVLAVRLDNLGDVLMTTPALAALRESLGGARLALLTSPSGAAAAPHLPMVDEVVTTRVPWMPAPGRGEPPPAELGTAECELVDRLVDGAFDAAVVFTVCTQSALPAALLLRMAGIPLRLAHARENPYGLLTDWVPETDLAVATGMRHEVQRQLDLVAAIGCRTGDQRLRFALQPADRVRVQARLAAAGIRGGDGYVVMHPGATAASRRWPAERFGAAAHRLAGDPGLPVVLCGDPAEVAPLEATAHALARTDGPTTAPVVSLAGELSLGELGALIHGASVVVCNNSAPAHLAAAVGTPVVALYALTNPQHTPWQANAQVLCHDVPCRWCLRSVCPQRHHACLLGVDTDEVVAAARALARTSRGAAPMRRPRPADDEPALDDLPAFGDPADIPPGAASATPLAPPPDPAGGIRFGDPAARRGPGSAPDDGDPAADGPGPAARPVRWPPPRSSRGPGGADGPRLR